MEERVRVIEAPAPIVTIEEARAHLSDLPAEDETYVKSLILAATTWIDGPTGWLGRPLGIQTLELSAPDFAALDCEYYPLPFSPVLAGVSVKFRRPDGVWDEVPADDRVFDEMGAFPAAGKSWPNVFTGRGDNVRIRYKVGCGWLDGDPASPVSHVPESIKFAILLLVAHWYASREPVVIGAPVADLPFTVDALLQPYRIYR